MSKSSQRRDFQAFGARSVALSFTALAALALAACGTDSTQDSGNADAETGAEDTITVEHAFGTSEIPANPERIATVQWSNHEVPLALGVVPVGMAAANFGDEDGDGLLPWVKDRLDELGGETPVLFDETDGIDFEAVADTQPDVILASHSGLDQSDYDTLSEIAPVVAYPESPWATTWRETIEYNSLGMAMADEGDELIADIEAQIDEISAAHPDLAGTTTMFITHVDTSDLSTVNFYTGNDPRTDFFLDLGMEHPEAVVEASESGEFAGSISAENVDVFDDVELIVTYGDEELVETLQADELLSQMPAIENDAIVFLDGATSFGTAANPTPLSISYVIEEYAAQLAEAAEQGQ